jgi:hypothetical protein
MTGSPFGMEGLQRRGLVAGDAETGGGGGGGGGGVIPPCCPDLQPDTACDVIDFRYRLTHTARVNANDRSFVVPVDVIVHFSLQRCPGPFALGDLVYTTTLLPGEKVRLLTTDRRSRFTFDSQTSLSYRNEQTSEEHFYLASMDDFMSDLTVSTNSSATNTSAGSAKGHGETSSFLGSIFGNPSVDVSGSYDARSTSDFMSELRQHANSSHNRAESGARAAATTSVGEVSTRAHTQGQSEDHFESSSREFSNPNHCHALTFFFYRIDKLQTVKWTLESVQRRVQDPAAPSKLENNRFLDAGDVGTIPAGVLATDKVRLDAEATGRSSVLNAQVRPIPGVGLAPAGGRLLTATQSFLGVAEPLPDAVRAAALQQVDQDLVQQGLIAAVGGDVSPDTVTTASFSLTSALPTPGLIVKGCLDDCDVCEPEVHDGVKLDLQHKRLENDLLQKQIDLLDKSQEYRCCPDADESGGGEA